MKLNEKIRNGKQYFYILNFVIFYTNYRNLILDLCVKLVKTQRSINSSSPLICMINFIKKIAENKVDESTHNIFTRYSLGEFVKDEFKIKVSSKDIKIWAGFEYVNTMLQFVASLCEGKITATGVIITDKDIKEILNKNKIEFTTKMKRGMRGVIKTEYSMNFSMQGKELIEFTNQLDRYYLLIDLSCGNRNMKIKKKAVPKIGASTEKFCTLTIEKIDLNKVIEEFLFDAKIKDFKEAILKHTYKIDKIDLNEKLLKEDPLKARLEAKREGTLIREIEIDGEKENKEYKMRV